MPYLENTPDQSKSMQRYQCDCCGKEGLRPNKHVNASKKRGGLNVFCSRQCNAKYDSEHNSSQCKCMNCGKDIVRKKYLLDKYHGKTFCSKSCASKFTRSKIKVDCSLSTERRLLARKNTKLKCLEYLGGRCSVCGYSKCVDALEFHHINPSNKEKPISQFARFTQKTIEELEKCVVLCANCHREEHKRLRETPMKD